MMASFITEIVRIFHSDYFDCRGAFQTVLDLYCCVTGLTMKRNGYFTFQTISDITGAHSTISFFRYAWIAEVFFKQFLIRNAV